VLRYAKHAIVRAKYASNLRECSRIRGLLADYGQTGNNPRVGVADHTGTIAFLPLRATRGFLATAAQSCSAGRRNTAYFAMGQGPRPYIDIRYPVSAQWLTERGRANRQALNLGEECE
jgi:hypothetical protein